MGGKVLLPEQWEFFNSRMFSKKEQSKYIGKYYAHVSQVLPVVKQRRAKIIDCCVLDRENYIYTGLALLLDDGFWHFGCPEKDEFFKAVAV